jgi:predicted nuclease of restriction endonuclease-like (RecB) superfamily
MTTTKFSPIYDRVRRILESARASAARSVNSAQVAANWLIGQQIVEEEQKGKDQAQYGEKIIVALSARLQREFGQGYSIANLKSFRQFYRTYPNFQRGQIGYAASSQSTVALPDTTKAEIGYAASSQSWRPGQWHPALSWTLYRVLMRVESPNSRAFYEIEAVQNAWSARELERQIASLLFERVSKSKDKAGVLELATKGQEIQRPADLFKDPMVIEFLGLPESPRLVEANLETALIDNLQTFLLELGKGFAFVARQKRITLDGDHFYIDLVFYHTILKCYVLVDLKVAKLTHENLGQLQLYVNYFDREVRTAGDNPTLGLVLCTDKNDAVVKYTLGPEQKNKIFTSRYQLHLPTETELKTAVSRELKHLGETH